MSIFGSLFGHDKKVASVTQAPALPTAPPTLPSPPPALSHVLWVPPGDQTTSALPAAPPPKRGAFDKDHYQQTMLALAAGFFGSKDLGGGLAAAAQSIASQNEAARAVDRPQIGGPDNAFEVFTDPVTGAHTYKPIQAATDYLEAKRIKGKDVLDANGRVVSAIAKMPPEHREQAFQDVRAHPEIYGAYVDHLPANWSDTYGQIAGSSGMTVSQSFARDQAGAAEANREIHRTAADNDRRERTAISRGRAAAATSQGAQRVAQAGARLQQGATRLLYADRADQRAQAAFAAANPVRINNPAQWAALPAGTTYVAPDGSRRTKK